LHAGQDRQSPTVLFFAAIKSPGAELGQRQEIFSISPILWLFATLFGQRKD
jgi:hypothetical protein